MIPSARAPPLRLELGCDSAGTSPDSSGALAHRRCLQSLLGRGEALCGAQCTPELGLQRHQTLAIFWHRSNLRPHVQKGRSRDLAEPTWTFQFSKMHCASALPEYPWRETTASPAREGHDNHADPVSSLGRTTAPTQTGRSKPTCQSFGEGDRVSFSGLRFFLESLRHDSCFRQACLRGNVSLRSPDSVFIPFTLR